MDSRIFDIENKSKNLRNSDLKINHTDYISNLDFED